MNVESALETDAQLSEPRKPGMGRSTHSTMAVDAITSADALRAARAVNLRSLVQAAARSCTFVPTQLTGRLLDSPSVQVAEMARNAEATWLVALGTYPHQ